MRCENFTIKDPEGIELFVYKWIPEETEVRGIVQISHGMAEIAYRYEGFAELLTENGYIVYANDHRGHGKTAKSIDDVGYIGVDGFNWMIKNMKQLNDRLHEENPKLPVFLFGHSMGSMLSQGYISLYGDTLDGVILSGTCGKQWLMVRLGIIVAKLEIIKSGYKKKSPRLDALSFGGYNKSFKPSRTKFDWLSRDEKEVDKYIDNPYCGGVFTTGFFYDLSRGLREIHKRRNMNRIPKGLPIYIFSGKKDPVGRNCNTVLWLVNEYKRLGIKDVSYKFYEDGRHEMLNEINKDEVIRDTLDWFNKHINSN